MMCKLLDCILVFSTLLAFSISLPPNWSSGYSRKSVGPFWPKNHQETEQFDDSLFNGHIKPAIDTIDPNTILSKEKIHQSFEDLASLDDFEADSELDEIVQKTIDSNSKLDRIWSPKSKEAAGSESESSEKCDKCLPGYGFVSMCNTTHGTVCEPCTFRSTYSDHVPHFKPCTPCSKCGPGMFEDYPCTPQADTFCDSCRERSRWPADDLWQNNDFVIKCASEFEKSRNNRNRAISSGLLKTIKDSQELSSEEISSGPINTVKITDLTKEDQEQLDRLYKSICEELKELDEEEDKMESSEAARLSSESHESESVFKFGDKKSASSKKSSEEFDEIFLPRHQNSNKGSPEILNIEKSSSSDSTKEIMGGIVEETIVVAEQYPAVDIIDKTTTKAVLPIAPIKEAAKKSFGAVYNVVNNKIEKVQPIDIDRTLENFNLPDFQIEPQRKIAFKPSAHSYPYEELIHPDQYRLKEIKKAIWLYGLTAAMLTTIIILLTCYTRSCLRFRKSVKMPSNLTDQDDRIITECARIMAEKEAPKKRPSIFESKSQDDSESSVNVLENPLIGYLEDCQQEPMVHASTESLIPRDEKRSKKNDNHIAIV